MKKLHCMAFALLLLPLAACGTLVDTASAAAVNASTTSVAQASSVKAAGDMYVLAEKAVHLYLTSGHATKAQADALVPVEAQVYKTLNDARAADKKGDSPALAAALSLFNSNYARLASLVPGLGG